MYLLQAGKAPKYFKQYEEHGMKVQLKHLPNLVGYYCSESEIRDGFSIDFGTSAAFAEVPKHAARRAAPTPAFVPLGRGRVS